MIRGLKAKPKQRRHSLSSMAGAVQRPLTVTPGTWIHDLMFLGKAVLLCMGCEGRMRKADLLKFGYEQINDHCGYDHVTSDCDGCRNRMVKCRFYRKRLTAR